MTQPAAAMLDAARVARDELESFVREGGDAVTDDHRRRLGLVIGRLETAACILDEADSTADATLGWVLAHEASELAHNVVQELIVPSAGGRVLPVVAEMARLRAATTADGDEMRRGLAQERFTSSG